LTAVAESRAATAAAPPRRRRVSKWRRSSPVAYIVLTVLAAYAIGPMVIFVFDALKTQADLGNNPLGPPAHLEWHNFMDAWTQASMGAGLVNSVIIVTGTVVGVCVIAGCAAYAMARLDLPGRGAVMMYLIVSSALPIQLFLVPLFYLWTRLNLYDTLFGLIVIYWAVFSPFATLLLRSFLIALPRDYEQAARIDGAGEITVLLRIVLPLSWPGVLTVALVTGLSAYNEFLLAVTFIQTPDRLPVSLAMFSFQQGYTQNYALISAAGLIMLAPMVILFLALQRRFISGLVSSGLSG
jgi:raffinose/stachyose/melibiose transport system permease protein